MLHKRLLMCCALVCMSLQIGCYNLSPRSSREGHKRSHNMTPTNKDFNADWNLLEMKQPDWVIGPFSKYRGNPLLAPTDSGYESRNVFNPSVMIKDGKFYMLYRAEDKDTSKFEDWRSELELAVSYDGLNWERYQDQPIIPATEEHELPGGCEDPRLFKYGDTYHVWYTGYHKPNKTGRVADQCHGTSQDLVHWKKHGPRGDKNDSVVINPHLEAVKVDGKFMLYNEDQIATSDDLYHWEYTEIDIRSQIPVTGSCVRR